MNSAQRQLTIYIKLMNNQIVNKRDLANDFSTSLRTIQRDISQIKTTFDNLNIPYKLEYVSNSNGYRLKSDQHLLNQQEVLVLIKILLASRSLNKIELNNTITGLLNLIDTNSKKKVTPLIKNELFYYKSLQHKQDLLNKVWTLSNFIIQKRSIQITYTKQHSETVIRNVLPQAIIFSEYYFYLVSYNPKYQSNLLYRIDRIQNYNVTDDIQLDYKDRFEDGDFRQKIQFMYPGKLIKIKFQFWGIVEAVLDRIPTAKVIQRLDANNVEEPITFKNKTAQSSPKGSVIIEAEVFGERGIMMWLLSQGKNVKVLSPESLVTNIKKETLSILNRYE